jgi:hypothetical protein
LYHDEQEPRGNLRTLRPGSRRAAGFAAVVVALWLVGSPIARGLTEACTCATARETNGWCPVHEQGYVGGVKVTSRWLYEFADAHGHQLDLSTFTCPTCRAAIATNGFCEVHRVGFVDKLAYYSLLTYELGKGRSKPVSTISCATCRKNSESHGWCAKSGVGMIGPFEIGNRQDFDRAVSALEIFLVANEASHRCNYCAGAILKDSECPACKIRYKDGKAVPRTP